MEEEVVEESTFSKLIQSNLGHRDIWLFRVLTGEDWHRFSLTGDLIFKWGETVNNDPKHDITVTFAHHQPQEYWGICRLRERKSGQFFEMTAYEQGLNTRFFLYQLHQPSNNYLYQGTNRGRIATWGLIKEGTASDQHLAATTNLLQELLEGLTDVKNT